MIITRRYRLTKSPLKKTHNKKLKGGSTVNANPEDAEVVSVHSEEIVNDKDKDQRCAPTASFKDGSCMSLSLLEEMCEAYNKSFENKIKLPKNFNKMKTLNPGKCKKILLKQFSVRLSDVCDDQRCWIKQDFIKQIKQKMKDELDNTFRPEGPKGKFEWLNTLNINDVMSQYEKEHSDFKFLGAVPVDFDDLDSLNIKNLDYDKLLKDGISKLGIVFNLDESYKSGSHWVAAYTDLKNGQVYYFDSYGIQPEKRISKYLRRCAKNCKSGGSNGSIDIRHNQKRHQRGDNACGVYSLNFIIRMLKGESFDSITENITTDKEVNKFREVYFT